MAVEIEIGSIILIFFCVLFIYLFFAPPKLPLVHGPGLLEAPNLAPGSHVTMVPEFYLPI